MKTLPKILVLLAVPLLIVGMIVSTAPRHFAPDWTLALPVGVVTLGMALICRIMQGEFARFDEEQRLKLERPASPRSSVSPAAKRPAQTSVSP